MEITRFALLFIVFQSSLVLSQSPCIPFAGSPRTFHICDEFVLLGRNEANIYLPPNASFDDLDQRAYSLLLQLLIAPRSCAILGYELLCRSVFRECAASIPLPFTPCKALCFEMVDKCSQPLNELLSIGVEASLPDCNTKDDATGQDLWPLSNVTYQTPLGPIAIPCSPPSDYSPSYLLPPQCPFPLGIDPDATDTSDPCKPVCPDPMFTKKEWGHFQTMMNVEGSISIIGSVYLATSYLLVKRRRTFPLRLNINLFVSSFFLGVAFVMSSNQQKVLCKNDSTYNSQSTSFACALQGSFLTLFLLSSACWWLVVCMNTFLMVVLGIQRSRVARKQTYLYIFAWGFPILLTIIALARHRIAAASPLLHCWIDFEEGGWWQYALLYIPVSVMLIACCVFFAGIIIKTHITRNTTKVVKISSERHVYIRIVSYIVFFIFIFTLFNAFRFQVLTQQDTLISEEKKWIACNLNQFLSFGFDSSSADVCGEVPPIRFNIQFHLAQLFFLGLQGVFLLVVFGTDREIFKFWKRWVLQRLRLHVEDTKSASIDSRSESVSGISLNQCSGIVEASSVVSDIVTVSESMTSSDKPRRDSDAVLTTTPAESARVSLSLHRVKDRD